MKDKGVICAVWPDEDMPVDAFGNRAMCIAEGEGTHRRTNYGRFAEHYMNATSMYVERTCRQYIQEGKLQEMKELYLTFIEAASINQFNWMMEECTSEQMLLDAIIDEVQSGIQVYLPHGTPDVGVAAARKLMERVPLPSSPVTYKGLDGNMVTTAKDVLVGSLYLLVLEKVGDDWGTTSIPRRQHHGIPGKLTDADKHALPWRDQAFKVFGESEVRLLLGVTDPMFVSSLVNFPNSPAMCMDAARTILTADKPTDINYVMDYRKHAELPGRSVLYFNHALEIAGIELTKGENAL